jgi:2-amino-4-hydroxy-6-hydroxymethyldihydropteridine diphosphokinase
MATGHLGLGSNLGDRREQLQAAVDALAGVGVVAIASSSTYETDPVGDVLDQPDFLNACLAVETELSPLALLEAVHAVEAALGRDRGEGYVHHGPRPIDIDVLLLGGARVDEPTLRVPHPALLERRFVLIPLLELDFGLTTPDGARLADALVALDLGEDVRRAGPPLRVPAPAR